MTATATRGRRALAVLTTAGALLLPAATAAAAPAEQASDRAGQGPASAGATEDTDTNDGGTPNNVADDGDNAHPSGKDRSIEHGRSGNQGKANSDPDDDGRGPDRTNGGADQPDGPGGVDKADQDGNNGCGNDDDFEDDNEGWCGRNPERGGPAATEDAAQDVEQDVEQDVVVDQDDDQDDANQAEETIEQGVPPGGFEVQGSTTTTADEVVTEVLGVTFTREDAPAATTDVLGAAIQEGEDDEAVEVAADTTGTLPRTGAGLVGLAAAGLSALAGGTALSRRRG